MSAVTKKNKKRKYGVESSALLNINFSLKLQSSISIITKLSKIKLTNSELMLAALSKFLTVDILNKNQFTVRFIIKFLSFQHQNIILFHRIKNLINSL